MTRTVKPFAEQGNYTQIHNHILDDIIPELKLAEIRVLLYLLRQTVGWHKQTTTVSYTQILEATNLGSRASVSMAIETLETKNLISVSPGSRTESATYSLNPDYEGTWVSSSKNEPPSTKSEPLGSSKNEPPGSSKSVLSKRKEELKKEREREEAKPSLSVVPTLETTILGEAKQWTQLNKQSELEPEFLDLIKSEFPTTNIEFEFKKFRSHMLSKGKPSLDWQEEFRSWLFRSVEFAMRNGIYKTQPAPMQQRTLEQIIEDDPIERQLYEEHQKRARKNIYGSK